jgi:hypothetical protein
VLRGRADEAVGLVGPAAREPLLAPAPRGGARLHVSRADLVGREPGAGRDAHGVPTPAHEQDGERVVVEALDTRDALGAVGVVGGEPLEPALEALGRDLDDAPAHVVLRIRC